MTATSALQVFRYPVRVYYEDTDAAGVVYYANYLKFMERARTEWLSALGFDLRVLAREHGIAFAVHHLDIRYHLPARLGEWLQVATVITERGRARMIAVQNVQRDSQLLVEARVTLACLDSVNWRPTRIPALIAARMENPV